MRQEHIHLHLEQTALCAPAVPIPWQGRPHVPLLQPATILVRVEVGSCSALPVTVVRTARLQRALLAPILLEVK